MSPITIKVAVIAFGGITPFHLSVPCLVFDAAPAGHFDVRVCAADGTPLATSAGFAIATSHGLEALDDADLVIMPSWHDDCRPAPPLLLAALRRAHERGARVVGLCLGAFPLAEAGLLNGKTATTHWAFADQLARRFPQVKVDSDVLYVDQGAVLTSAGVAAGLDCCLHLLRQLCGAELANAVARQLVIAPHRQGGQAQFIERPLPVSRSDGRFADVLAWVGERLEHAHSIDQLAARAAMSRRHFTRHFRQATGSSFKQWLLAQRLALARRLLESSDAAIEVVAQQAGFGSALSLRQHFKAALQLSPSAYRKGYRN
ncbi:HTH-type transcriptional regulator CdhR [Duganella phyllosphaerae]|uniref:HTH-type transcriptional regulator CdhR n=1 Tax=Duganella phyllosphaerae TaxID=762836 RepID=A0A1E7WKN2_9BURK|nr:helix-turn-helix domain-containing protein [Duganella phyllosphaerae]OEZ99550.1 HTH-type transcriptional regulator CdhR [Duganella phyllosphaerae]